MLRVASGHALVVIALLLSGCAVARSPEITRIALLAPFEGRYRDVGYQALYAARLAIADTDRIDLELLAVDDGGSTDTAQDRARALNKDPLVAGVLVLGVHAAEPTVLEALQPYTLVVGHWNPPLLDATEQDPHKLTDIAALETPFVCGDVCLLESFLLLADAPALATIRSAAPPVDADFRQRYLDVDLYVPEPLPFANLTYEATAHMIRVVDGAEAQQQPEWLTNPAWTYCYADGSLISNESANLPDDFACSSS